MGLRRGTRAAAVALAAAVVLGACGTSSSGGGSSSDSGKQLAGASFKVGSKEFTESIILGKILKYVLEDAGATVEDKTNIKGSANTREAMTNGEIHMYWEYTGTAWETYLGHDTVIADQEEQYQKVKEEDLAKNKVAWLPMSPMVDVYALATTKDFASAHNLTKDSQIASLPVEEQTFCLASEFLTRPDGWPGFTKAYGISPPESNLRQLALGSIYSVLAKGKDCNFGEVFTTDGRILALNLVVLEDDKKFFPNYNAAVTMMQATLDEHPELAGLFAPVSEKITNSVMTELNAQVDVEGDDADDVAKKWLEKEGLIS